MKVTALALVRNMCEIFVLNFEDSITNVPMNRLIHDKSWKESDEKLEKLHQRYLISYEYLITKLIV
jgi:hypothetical protein